MSFFVKRYENYRKAHLHQQNNPATEQGNDTGSGRTAAGRQEFLIQNLDVYIGMLPSGEIDFVAKNGDKAVYFQVAYKLSGIEIIGREFGNLQAIGDNYPKYVVTMEEITGPLKDYPGIRHIHLREFLNMDF